jgi:hypothetical protein
MASLIAVSLIAPGITIRELRKIGGSGGTALGASGALG